MNIITQQLTNFYKGKKGYKGAVLKVCIEKDLKSIREQTNKSDTYLLDCCLEEVILWDITKEGWDYWNERNSYFNELIKEEN